MKDTITKFSGKGTEYYIGLTKDRDGSWRWISNNSKVNESYWAQQTGDTNSDCAIMYKDYNSYYGLFDDLPCVLPKHGYICESKCHLYVFRPNSSESIRKFLVDKNLVPE